MARRVMATPNKVDNTKLLDALYKQTGTTSDADLAAILKVSQSKIRDWRNARYAPSAKQIDNIHFPHLSGRYVGQPIRDFVRTWRTACKAAGCPWMLRHDFRRTAVRNLVNSETPERVAMTMTGHKTGRCSTATIS